MEIIALDSHKRYTFARVEDQQGKVIWQGRIEHERGNIRKFLQQFTPGSTVAVETIGSWYWIVAEIEEAGMRPALVNALKAKRKMCSPNKTDKLDAKGLNDLQRSGTLPEVWIPPAELRDKRDLARTRMVFSQMRTKMKNRIHAALDKYALGNFGEVSDIFGKRNRLCLEEHVQALPAETRFTTHCLLKELDSVEHMIGDIERRMREVFGKTPQIEALKTLPGIGFLLGVVIAHEMGDTARFPRSENFACYAGTTPRVHSSGGKTRFGHLRVDVNRYLKWAFIEAANSVCTNRGTHPDR